MLISRIKRMNVNFFVTISLIRVIRIKNNERNCVPAQIQES